MTRRLATTVLLACVVGCVPDPKVDACRGRPERCDEADATTASGERDAATDAGVASHGEAGIEAPFDAGPQRNLDAMTLDTGVVHLLQDGATPMPRTLALLGDLGVHDPSIIEAEGVFTIFSTGRGLPVKRSTDLLTWTDDGSVFTENPAWIASQVSGVSDLWAPDISYFGGKYHLYYAASTFGSRTSCIGHATASSLSSLDFVDQGPVLCTKSSNSYNAIDPAFITDEEGTGWLSFGSFGTGIKLIRLDAEGQRSGTELYALASRDKVEAIEAPYILRHDGYYYLFVSFDLCCQGSASTYRIMVGRSPRLTGPYFDAEGTPMLGQGGGSMLVVGNQRWRGPGHNAVVTTVDDQYLVYHAYDANRSGAPTLRISELLWDGYGWPVPTGP